MIEINDNTYAQIAHKLTERLAAVNFFNGSLECDCPEGIGTLTATLIVYRDRETIADVVPVWWEFHLMQPAGEVLSDFCWSELRAYLTEPMLQSAKEYTQTT